MGGDAKSGHSQPEYHCSANDEQPSPPYAAPGAHPDGSSQRADSSGHQQEPLTPGAHFQHVHRKYRHQQHIGIAEETVEEGHGN